MIDQAMAIWSKVKTLDFPTQQLNSQNINVTDEADALRSCGINT